MKSLWNGVRIAMALSIRDGARRNSSPYVCCCADVWETEKVIERDNMQGRSKTKEPSGWSDERIRICRVFQMGGYLKPLPFPRISLFLSR